MKSKVYRKKLAKLEEKRRQERIGEILTAMFNAMTNKERMRVASGELKTDSQSIIRALHKVVRT
jgi:hypothetical protein